MDDFEKDCDELVRLHSNGAAAMALRFAAGCHAKEEFNRGQLLAYCRCRTRPKKWAMVRCQDADVISVRWAGHISDWAKSQSSAKDLIFSDHTTATPTRGTEVRDWYCTVQPL